VRQVHSSRIEVFREDGARMHDAGSHVPIIPLVDTPFVAALLAAVSLSETTKEGQT